MNSSSTLGTLVGVVRHATGTPAPLVCPCGGEVVLGGRAVEVEGGGGLAAWCTCGHLEHAAGGTCYRPKCRCPGAPEDHPKTAVYRCATCGVCRLSLTDLILAPKR